MAGISYHPDDLRASDIDLRQREIRVRSKRGQERIVKIGHQATLSLDRYLRARARNPQAWRQQLWHGVHNRESLTAQQPPVGARHHAVPTLTSPCQRREPLDAPGGVRPQRPPVQAELEQIRTVPTADTETTASLLAWTFHLLAAHPASEQRLWDEVDAPCFLHRDPGAFPEPERFLRTTAGHLAVIYPSSIQSG